MAPCVRTKVPPPDGFDCRKGSGPALQISPEEHAIAKMRAHIEANSTMSARIQNGPEIHYGQRPPCHPRNCRYGSTRFDRRWRTDLPLPFGPKSEATNSPRFALPIARPCVAILPRPVLTKGCPMKIVHLGLRYSPDLGDRVTSECLSYGLQHLCPGVEVDTIDIFNRDPSDGGTAESETATIDVRPRLIRPRGAQKAGRTVGPARTCMACRADRCGFGGDWRGSLFRT